MPTIELETEIAAPIERVFDLSRCIDAHIDSASKTKEQAVAGRTSGLIECGETVTWSAVHFGIRQRLTVRITELQRPNYFVDEMVSGAFKRMRHRHDFLPTAQGTLMKDVFEFDAPFGLLGRMAEKLILDRYMTQFLETRNAHLKCMLEDGTWTQFLSSH